MAYRYLSEEQRCERNALLRKYILKHLSQWRAWAWIGFAAIILVVLLDRVDPGGFIADILVGRRNRSSGILVASLALLLSLVFVRRRGSYPAWIPPALFWFMAGSLVGVVVHIVSRLSPLVSL